MISIIIPTYNRATIIPKALDSILNQTYKDWECIVVDDHSTDDTKQVIEEYIAKDSRFHYLVNNRKKGAQGARNTGLYSCNSEWVYFFDSDNKLHPNCLEELASNINENVDVVQCFSQVLSVDTQELKRLFDWKNYGNIHKELLFAHTYTDFNQAIIRRSKLLEISGLDEDCPCMQEWETHIRLSKNAIYTTVEQVLVDYFVGAKDAISTNPKRDVVGKTYVLSKNIEEWNQDYKSLKRNIFYLTSLIGRQDDKQFRKESYERLLQLVPAWDVYRGRLLSKMLYVKEGVTRRFKR